MFVLFPVTQEVRIPGCTFTSDDFEHIRRRSFSDILDESGVAVGTFSMDVVGSIAILRLQDEAPAGTIARAILAAHRNIKTVCLDRGVHDEFRVRTLEVIAGEPTTVTTHTEYGITMNVDVGCVYFSPRLARERQVVARQVEKGETVVDLFAGVAPFSLHIARYAKPKKIYAIDKNPHAVAYARENVRVNRVENVVEILYGDARKLLADLPRVDRIVMNLPHRSYAYLTDALAKGRVIHHYEILEGASLEKRGAALVSLGREHGYEVSVRAVRIVGSYSPGKVRAAYDLQVQRI
jgi:tRNA (guanine37-N1)-methyltransferase